LCPWSVFKKGEGGKGRQAADKEERQSSGENKEICKSDFLFQLPKSATDNGKPEILREIGYFPHYLSKDFPPALNEN